MKSRSRRLPRSRFLRFCDRFTRPAISKCRRFDETASRGRCTPFACPTRGKFACLRLALDRSLITATAFSPITLAGFPLPPPPSNARCCFFRGWTRCDRWSSRVLNRCLLDFRPFLTIGEFESEPSDYSRVTPELSASCLRAPKRRTRLANRPMSIFISILG